MTADEVRDWKGNIIPTITEPIPPQCLACDKFKAPSSCGKCGCPSEAKQLRDIPTIMACPLKKFIRRGRGSAGGVP